MTITLLSKSYVAPVNMILNFNTAAWSVSSMQQTQGIQVLLFIKPDQFYPWILTRWDRDIMAAVLQTVSLSVFSWTKIHELRFRVHWNLFLMVESTMFQHWFRYWLGASQATGHYLKQWWLVYWRIYGSLELNEVRFIHSLSCCYERLCFVFPTHDKFHKWRGKIVK